MSQVSSPRPNLFSFPLQQYNDQVSVEVFKFYFIYFGCESKDSLKSELNHCTSQELNGEKTRKTVSDLGVEEKPKRNISRKANTVWYGLRILPDCLEYFSRVFLPTFKTETFPRLLFVGFLDSVVIFKSSYF